MGPHPEVPVDVQKYIGSCLIAQQPRSKRKSRLHADGSLLLQQDGARFHGGGAPSAGYAGISNYVWTGVPLISVARQKGPHHVLKPRHNPPLKILEPEHSGEGCLEDILPISRLAIHAQGAPLILSRKDCEDSEGYLFKNRDAYQRQHVCMLLGSEEMSASSSVRMPEETELMARQSPSQSDCVSTTSEDSGTSENGLPRIIKPRKRRKKDRRGPDTETGKEDRPGGIVTLKPYQPLCYQYSKSSSTLDVRAPRSLTQGVYPYPPSSRCRCPYCVPPPSTFLTPPDSPVEISDSGLTMAVARGRQGLPRDPFGTSPLQIHRGSSENLFQINLEDGSFKSHLTNAVVLTSSHPPQRPWICMTDHDPKLSSCTFTVMCYNILCDKYATRQMYGYCPNWALDWTYRKTSIMQEILHYKADIISLQEVETEQFYKFFLPELKKDGYDGIFSPKSRAKTMAESERKHVDGCAIFYKSSKFYLLKEHLMEFNQLAMANAEGSDDMLNRVMTKDNIGLAALLQTRVGAYHPGTEASQANQTLLVCTAHIHWDPEFSDVKLVQTMMLMHELRAFVDDILAQCDAPPDPNAIPMLLCGDFNSLPDSGVIEYLSSGRVSSSHCDFKDIVYKDCLSKLGNSEKTNEFTHPFRIARAYNDGIMPFTNYSFDFKGVIDYVFHSRPHLTVLGVLGPVDAGWLAANRVHGCPHPHVPSDHFPIVVELQLDPTPPLRPHNGLSALHRR